MTRRIVPIALVLLALLTGACSGSGGQTTTTAAAPSTTTTTVAATTSTPSTTTTATPATTQTASVGSLAEPASSTCDEFAAAPFPERHSILEAAADSAGATTDDLLASMTVVCPETAATYTELEHLTSRSAALTDDDGNYVVDSGQACGAEITAYLTNQADFPIGVVVGLYRGTDSSGLDEAAIVVVPTLDPGEQIEITKTLGSSPDLGCLVVTRPFLTTPGSDATDTWDPPAGARALPTTGGDDWLTIMQTLIDTEDATGESGAVTEFGMTEDVRSAEYNRLVTSESGGSEPAPATDVTEICDVTHLNDDLVNVTYVADRDGDTYTVSGLFRRSPQDLRWRWLQLAFYLSDGNACSRLNGVFTESTGESI